MISPERGGGEEAAKWRAPSKEGSPAVVAAQEEAAKAKDEHRAFKQMEDDMRHEMADAQPSAEASQELQAVWGAKVEAGEAAQRATLDASALRAFERSADKSWPIENVRAASLAIDAGDIALLLKAEKVLDRQIPKHVEKILQDQYGITRSVQTLEDVANLEKYLPDVAHAIAKEIKVAKELVKAKKMQG